MKLKIYKKKKCLLATPYEETTYNDPLLHNIRETYEPIELNSIESYFVEQVNNGLFWLLKPESLIKNFTLPAGFQAVKRLRVQPSYSYKKHLLKILSE